MIEIVITIEMSQVCKSIFPISPRTQSRAELLNDKFIFFLILVRDHFFPARWIEIMKNGNRTRKWKSMVGGEVNEKQRALDSRRSSAHYQFKPQNQKCHWLENFIVCSKLCGDLFASPQGRQNKCDWIELKSGAHSDCRSDRCCILKSNLLRASHQCLYQST